MELTRTETELIEMLRGQTGENFAITVVTIGGLWHVDRHHLDSTGHRNDATGYESGRGPSFNLAWNDLSNPRPSDDKSSPLTVV